MWTESLIPTGFFLYTNRGRFDQPRSQGSLPPVPTERERETGRRENLETRLRRDFMWKQSVYALRQNPPGN